MTGEAGSIKLYHASYVIIEKIDLRMCDRKNDFGQGFYTTTDRSQAIRFVKTTVKKRSNSKFKITTNHSNRHEQIYRMILMISALG
jgi:hypothetical protein